MNNKAWIVLILLALLVGFWLGWMSPIVIDDGQAAEPWRAGLTVYWDPETDNRCYTLITRFGQSMCCVGPDMPACQ